MILTHNIARRIFFCLLIYLISPIACHRPAHLAKTADSPQRIRHLLVIPFKDMVQQYGENTTRRSPLSGKVFTTGKVAEGSDIFLTDHLLSLLKRHDDLQLISPDLAQGVWARLITRMDQELPELSLVVETGRELGADAVLVGYVYRFKDRLGTRYSVDVPASVAFDLELVGIAERRVIWSGRFDETQQALTEDLFQFEKFIKRKGRWITARDMAAAGLEELLETLPIP